MRIIGGPISPAQWLARRLSEASPRDGDPGKNQYLPDDGMATTDPVRTTHSIFNRGTQGERE